MEKISDYLDSEVASIMANIAPSLHKIVSYVRAI